MLKRNEHLGDFHPLEVVDRGSETQPQVGEIYIIYLSASRVNLLIIILKDIDKTEYDSFVHRHFSPSMIFNPLI